MNPVKDEASQEAARSIKSDNLEFASVASHGCVAVRDAAIVGVAPGRGPTAAPCPNAFGAVSAGTRDRGLLTLCAVNAPERVDLILYDASPHACPPLPPTL
jgi:hypothetical protein